MGEGTDAPVLVPIPYASPIARWLRLAAVAMTVLLAVPTPARASSPPAAAWVVVDADSGAVLEEANARTPLPPASLTKVLTALAVVGALPPSATVAVSQRAADVPFGWLMEAGEQWRVDDALPGLLIGSANDAAMALAEAASGSVEAFAATMDATAAALGMRDRPVLRDPVGLDGPEGLAGGNLISAGDLAIAARALLAEPRLAPLVGLRDHTVVGRGGAPQRLVSHNKFLRSYPGAMGMKTGYTGRAGYCLIAVARREGRTLIAVVMRSPRMYASASVLLDRGFASRRAPPADWLPARVWPLPPTPVVEVPASVPDAHGVPAAAVRPKRPVLASSSAVEHGVPKKAPSALRASFAVIVIGAMVLGSARLNRASRGRLPPLKAACSDSTGQ